MRKVNYHTHTKRCHHAVGEDEEYVEMAIVQEFEELGFSDHAPWRYATSYRSPIRMELSEFEDYKRSILELKELYKNEITILFGLEVEYFPRYMGWLKDFIKEEKLEYIILGHHFNGSDEDGEYFGRGIHNIKDLTEYVDQAIDAMKSGLYSYMAHPDLFMRCLKEFDEAAKEQCVRLCEASIQYNTPLEYNLNGLLLNHKNEVEEYPYDAFWDIAADLQVDVMIGFDAHNPKLLARTDLYEEAIRTLESKGLHIQDRILKKW